jgi:hypothetical protein
MFSVEAFFWGGVVGACAGFAFGFVSAAALSMSRRRDG